MSDKTKHYDVIRKPIITEKATMASENGAVVFEVSKDASKPQIKAAANIDGLDVLPSIGANVYDILKRDTLVITKAGVEALEARLK